jgi:hypothetical protein
LRAIQRSDQKLRPFRTGTLVSREETSASPSSDFTLSARKTAFRNSCKNLRAIQISDQKLRHFRTGNLVSRAETSASPSSDSTSTAWKTAFGNSSKNLRAIQHSDQKLRPFRTGTLVSSEETSSLPSNDSHLLQGKRLSQTPVKFEDDPTVGSKVTALSNRYAGLER